jgi:hypothetical protein
MLNLLLRECVTFLTATENINKFRNNNKIDIESFMGSDHVSLM